MKVNKVKKFGFLVHHSREIFGGVQYEFKFKNGRGASVIRNKGSYGFSSGLWELAVLNSDDQIDYNTPITDDVVGFCSAQKIRSLLTQIQAL